MERTIQDDAQVGSWGDLEREVPFTEVGNLTGGTDWVGTGHGDQCSLRRLSLRYW